MLKPIIVFLLIFTGIFISVKAQTYSIKSFEGYDAKINLYYKPESGILSIGYLQDTISINDYLSVDTAIVLDKIFLLINYAKRAGSNEDAVNQILLYVLNGKLCQALHVNSLWNYDLRPSKYSLFKLGLKLSGHDVSTYKLTVNIHNEKRSARNPKSNYSYNKIKSLSFDKTKKIFYNSYEYVIGNYTFHNLNNKNSGKKYLESDVPVVNLGKDKYYYINGDWYTKDKTEFYSMLL